MVTISLEVILAGFSWKLILLVWENFPCKTLKSHTRECHMEKLSSNPTKIAFTRNIQLMLKMMCKNVLFSDFKMSNGNLHLHDLNPLINELTWEFIQIKIPKNLITKLLNPLQDGYFRGCSRKRGGVEAGGGKNPPLTKTCHTYPAMVKFGTTIQIIYKSRDTSIEFWWNQHFFTESLQLLLYQQI